MTYKQAYDKIIDAYFKDEIKPMMPKFCFCGTLAGSGSWGFYGTGRKSNEYTFDEFSKMELALLDAIDLKVGKGNADDFKHPLYEDGVFNGMTDALDVLRQIHIDRGEIIDEVPVFNKRQLYDDIPKKE